MAPRKQPWTSPLRPAARKTCLSQGGLLECIGIGIGNGIGIGVSIGIGTGIGTGIGNDIWVLV